MKLIRPLLAVLALAVTTETDVVDVSGLTAEPGLSVYKVLPADNCGAAILP